MEKITSRIMHWSTRFLSCAGRLTLIKSVLFSIQVYWSSLFILPKAILKEISGLLRNFLWNGSDIKKGIKLNGRMCAFLVIRVVWGLKILCLGTQLL